MRASGIRRCAAGVALLIGATGVSPLPSPASPDADRIFANVRQAWGAGAYPRYATYTTVVEFHTATKHVRRTWETVEDFRHAIVFSRKFSREELASPPDAPRGINVALPFVGVLNKVEQIDPVGHVAFAVDQDYGISPAERHLSTAVSGSGFSAKRTELPVIGRTGTIARSYDVKLIETLSDERGTEYHLALTPLRDPQHHRLRELWVDATTWTPEEAVVAGIGDRAPLQNVPWRIDYRQFQGGTYIARETALADVDYGGAGVLHWLTISFDEVAPSASPSGWKYQLGSSDDNPIHDP
jgi:hypothetical protein